MSLPKCKDFTDYNRYPGEENPTTDAQMQDYLLNQNLILHAAAARMWQPSTEYAVGDVVSSPSMPSGTEAVCTGAGMSDSALEPSWAIGSVIPDGSCFWQVRYVHYTMFLASESEALGGVDAKKIITPSTLKAVLDAVSQELNVGVKTINGSAPDAGGNINIGDYVSNLTISGKTITVTFKDGTTKTLNTQDTGITLSSTITVTKSAQNAITPTWSLHGKTGTAANSQTWSILNVNTGIAAGTYTIQNLIQQLVSKSHTHGKTTLSYTNNNCNCSNSCNDCH